MYHPDPRVRRIVCQYADLALKRLWQHLAHEAIVDCGSLQRPDRRSQSHQRTHVLQQKAGGIKHFFRDCLQTVPLMIVPGTSNEAISKPLGRYVQVCRLQVCKTVGIMQVSPKNTYMILKCSICKLCRYITIRQYLQVFLSYRCINTCHTCGYLQIHTIPQNSDIATDTNSIYTYIQYIQILIYPHIPNIPANTHNTCIQ